MISVLFARKDSIYKTLDCDVWDADRDAMLWPGGNPLIAHPPCRSWGKLRHFARPREGEQEAALWAVQQVRQYGGALEHPCSSLLWQSAGLPHPGKRDAFGGFTIWILQWWFGHRAAKATWIYVCGTGPSSIPSIPYRMGEATHTISYSRRVSGTAKPEVSKAEREHTPVALARWLITIAERCNHHALEAKVRS